MRVVKLFLILVIFPAFINNSNAQNTDTAVSQKVPVRLNFVVSPKLDHFSWAPLSFQLQAKINSLFHKNFYLVIASSSQDMTEKITRILNSKNAMIGSIWFDSHGHFTRRHSLFEIGEDEFNYKSVQDSLFSIHLKKLSAFCDSNTKVGIGSCYGGSTSTLPAVENFPAQRMNGDSLMMGVSKLLNNSKVFASESFVMTPPGIFKSGYKLSGLPGRKIFVDSLYLPIWEKLGEWNCYEGTTREFFAVNTVSIDPDGSIYCKPNKFLGFAKNKKKQLKKMMALKRGNYNFESLYQVER